MKKTMKANDISDKRFLAEWENPVGVLMAFPNEDTDWDYILEDAIQQFTDIISAFVSHKFPVYLLCKNIEETKRHLKGIDIEFVCFIEAEFNDTWTRDYGPITISKEGKTEMLDFGFNGWGLKFAADKDNLINLQLRGKEFIPCSIYRNNRDFILEGGSLETDGNGTLLTTSTCLCSQNRNGGKSKKELDPILTEKLGVSKILWLDNGFLEGDDTDSHIDTLARFAPQNIIIYTGPGEEKGPQHISLMKMRDEIRNLRNKDGEPFKLIELPLPDPIFSEEMERLPATYANYLVTGETVFYPTYSQPEKDKAASECLKEAFPHHDIVGIDCRVLLLQHGSLHCSTMQLYASGLIR